MIWKLIKRRIPEWIAGPLILIAATDPFLKLRTCCVLRYFDSEVHAAESGNVGYERLYFFGAALALQNRVAAVAVGEAHHGISIVRGVLVFDPTHFSPHGQAIDFGELFFEEDGPCSKFVHHQRVARLAGNEDEFARLFRFCKRSSAQAG